MSIECRERDMTYAAPLRVNVQLQIMATGEIKESEIFLGDFPLMTENGTFVINGAERVVVSQLVRSPGVYFKQEKDPTSGRSLHSAKLIPNRGAWLEFETATSATWSRSRSIASARSRSRSCCARSGYGQPTSRWPVGVRPRSTPGPTHSTFQHRADDRPRTLDKDRTRRRR